MSLPWVSRESYDMLIALHNATAQDLTASFERFDALLEKYHALKLAGASVPEPKAEPQPPKEPDPVTSAIIARAGKSQALRKHYYEFVNEQRKEGVPDDEIAHAILTGVDDDAGVPA